MMEGFYGVRSKILLSVLASSLPLLSEGIDPHSTQDRANLRASINFHYRNSEPHLDLSNFRSRSQLQLRINGF
ncbi:hypothetical protein F5050DRAFT_1745299 [Lentinula boryana]|uniref:Uncharacterized protein n=1 Tax=Lentinula boryana TaxID=40481 RepID=A0ABQ8QIW8_9AGAR|nr:hypothetical protein F5050DRAFT_1745299 [Lentinula boryana]